MEKPLQVIALLSGGGRTLLNLHEQMISKALPIEIDLVMASRADALGLERASALGLETAVVPSANFRFEPGGDTDWSAMSRAMDEVILPRQPNLICLCGFMCFYELPLPLIGRVINIHPALLPKHGGRGMYGSRVHNAVLAAGESVSGCTVHYVTNEYDAGPVILQKECPVFSTDTEAELAARVFALECEAYPEAIRRLARGEMPLGTLPDMKDD